MTRSSPTAAPAASTIDPHGWEDDDDYARRIQLGLRPITIKHREEGFEHPDRRPCPAWCWWAQNGHEHELTADLLTAAQHATESISVASTVYDAAWRSDEFDGLQLATWELDLHRPGRGIDRIRMRLNLPTGGEDDGSVVVLNIDDAREIATVLQYFVAQSDADAALTEATS